MLLAFCLRLLWSTAAAAAAAVFYASFWSCCAVGERYRSNGRWLLERRFGNKWKSRSGRLPMPCSHRTRFWCFVCRCGTRFSSSFLWLEVKDGDGNMCMPISPSSICASGSNSSSRVHIESPEECAEISQPDIATFAAYFHCSSRGKPKFCKIRTRPLCRGRRGRRGPSGSSLSCCTHQLQPFLPSQVWAAPSRNGITPWDTLCFV